MTLDAIFVLSISAYDYYLLPFALIIGWFLVIFFLHLHDVFSFFTVLTKRVLRDLFQFGVLFVALLIGFSIAMYVAMRDTQESEDDSFTELPKTFLKMLTVMVGIGEIDILLEARHPTLVVLIFGLIVITTTLLLLNALIAAMSNTCSTLTVSVSTQAYAQLQKLETIIHIEAILPSFMLKPAVEATVTTSEIGKRRILSLKPENDSPKSYKDENPQEQIIEGIARFVGTMVRKPRGKKRQVDPKLDETKTAMDTGDGKVDIYQHPQADSTQDQGNKTPTEVPQS